MPKRITADELANRELLIINTACEIIEQQGFSSLTMDKVVDAVPFSKGSVYKLFNSVEEIILAITNDGSSVLLEYMNRARHYGGNSRERNLARAFAYHLYGQLYPTHFFCELQAIGPNVREKASPKRLMHGLQLLRRFKQSSEGFVSDAIACGDLPPMDEKHISRLANCSWSAEFGVTSYALASSEQPKNIDAGVRAQLETDIFWLVTTYMDGLKWQPLSDACDDEKSWQTIKSALFAEEIERLNSVLPNRV